MDDLRQMKAIGLISGGLDSTLAAKIIKELGFDVLGLNFFTGFCVAEHRQRLPRQGESPPRNEALRAGADLEIPVELIDISKEYLKMLKKPRFGFGANVNPCLDCRIMMLGKAKDYMERLGAEFVFTGEVLGQRPMTQRMDTLRLVEKESGLDGHLLRPLSAKLLPETEPEKKGIIRRETLYGIKGRSRKEQMSLAEEFGVVDYPTPAGGCCFLTDENYARRFRDLLAHKKDENLSMDDIMLLKVGRHFRTPSGTKFIVGRDIKENAFLGRYADGRIALQAEHKKGPLTLVEGTPDESELELIAAITAKYSKGGADDELRVQYSGPGMEGVVAVMPAELPVVERHRI
jgi:tRNA U34 2-thiouridine synthase MnmA/TrmU